MRNVLHVVRRLTTISPDDCGISTITGYELYTGVDKCTDPGREAAKVECFLRSVHAIPFDWAAAQEAARIRADLESRGCPIGPYDVLLAGQATAAGLILVSANRAEFGRVVGLSLEDWSK